MINYLIQKKQITSAQKQEILMDKLCTAGSNMTGFSAQSTTVGATGTYNEYITYMTMDYSYTASVHSVMSLRMLVGNYMPMFNIGVSGGYAVRLIMK